MRNLFTLLLFVSSLALIAQTGPGGVGNTTNNIVWLDAAQIQQANGTPVATWPDKSGNGNSFTQGTASRQPTFVANGVNAEPIVDFNYDFLELGATAAFNATDFSEFIVTRADNNNHVGIVTRSGYTSGAAAGSQTYWGTYLSTNGNQFYTHTRTSSGVPVFSALGYQAGYNILSSVIASSSASISGYLNNNLTNSAIGYNSTPTGHLLTRIGANSTTTPNGNYLGNVAEIIIYNTALNSAQHNIVNNYLAARYRRTIANDLFAHDLSHYFEVFGVGQEADGGNYTAQGTGIVAFSSPTLTDGDYILAGHNNSDLLFSTTDVPASIAPASRLQRVWRITATGTPGTLTVSFDITNTVFAGETAITLVVENGDGIFNNGGTTEYGPVTPVGGIATFTGVSLPDNSYFTIAGPPQPIESVVSGNWSAASTWNCGCVPGQNNDATIKAGHTVTVDVNTNINSLTTEATSTLSFNASRRLFVSGDLVVDGAFSHSTGLLEFNGTGTQQFLNSSGNTITLYNLYVTGGSTVELQTGNFEIDHSIYVSSGQLANVSGTITMLSTATKTAIILPGVANAFSGQFLIQRYISQRNASWGDLCSPVSGETLGGWDSDESGTVTEIIMSGVGGIDGNAGTFQSVYYFDENTQAYVAVTDTNQALTPGRGFEVWLEDSNSTWLAKSFDSKGTPNSGNLVVPVKNGWNLVGNPYQNRILWSNLTKPTLNSTFYIWNTNNGSYDAFTNAGISPHQGFWVESVGNGNLTFTESSKSTSTSSEFLRLNEEIEPYVFSEVRLKVSSEINTYAHELKLRMNNLATINHDYHDGTFLPSRVLEAPSIYSYSANNNKKLVINSFNYQDEVVLPIAVEVGVSGKYILEAINFENLAHDYSVMELKDNQTGKVYDLTSQKAITVLIDEFETGERFSLRLSNQVNNTVNGMEQQIAIYKSNEVTVIEFDDVEQNYVVSVYNALGQKIIEDQIVSNTNRFELQNSSIDKGLVIIKVSSSKGEIVQKLTY
ncbi:MAG TPA: T9SS type A sorting domain-containing protein [Vicingaceae bacterium]